MEDLYSQYALLDAQEKEIKAKKEAMRTDIVKAMVEAGEQSITHTLGKFTVSQVKSWTYPERIEQLAEEVKAEKAKAESTGEATCVETPSLRYTATKF